MSGRKIQPLQIRRFFTLIQVISGHELLLTGTKFDHEKRLRPMWRSLLSQFLFRICHVTARIPFPGFFEDRRAFWSDSVNSAYAFVSASSLLPVGPKVDLLSDRNREKRGCASQNPPTNQATISLRERACF